MNRNPSGNSPLKCGPGEAIPGEKGAVLYAVVLAAVNWHWSREVETGSTTTTLTLDGGGIAALISAVLLCIVAKRLFHLVRRLLDERVRVPRDVKLFSWLPLVCLAPLLMHIFYSYSNTDGAAKVAQTFGYGSGDPAALLVVASILCLVFQVYSTLKRFLDDPGIEGLAGRRIVTA